MLNGMAAAASALALVSIWGPDRPGILHDVSRLLLEQGLNIADSRAVMLTGHFALLVLVSGTAVRSETSFRALEAGLQKALGGGQLELRLSRVSSADDAGTQMQLDVSGQDRAGVLHKIAHLLRVLNVNIEGIHAGPQSQGGGKSQAAASSTAKSAAKSVAKAAEQVSRAGAGTGAGAAKFQLSLLLRVPPQTPKEMLRDYIAQLCTELGVKWSLSGGQAIAVTSSSSIATRRGHSARS
jgi:glycine cleavage system transcriptional repressor